MMTPVEIQATRFHEQRLIIALGPGNPNRRYRNVIPRTLKEKIRIMYRYKSKYLNQKNV